MSYILPDGNVLISFSGGRTSAYMLHEILAANGNLDPKSVQVIFSNTGREMPATLDFVQKCSERWSVPIMWLEYTSAAPKFQMVCHENAARNGEPFDELIDSKKILPNVLMRFCTTELKIKTAERFLKVCGWKEWTNMVGIRSDEMRRVDREPQGNGAGRWVRGYPLADNGIDKDVVAKFWERQPFDLGIENINGSNVEGNCDLCFCKSELKLATMLRKYPERAKWWSDWENKMKHRGNYGKFSTKQSRADLEKFVTNQGDWIFDQEDALCQADEGECTG
tara:strand:- start:44 stop:883 length:840 start_codon:yes stop_codon:yes gene_type:complete